MKRIYSVLVSVLCITNIWAQAPDKMSYQAVIRDASNVLVTEESVGIKISILQGFTSGNVSYSETHTPTTNANGLVSVEIGSGTVISGVFSGINWSEGPYFIKTETDPSGGTNYTITGVNQILSVSYALHASTANTVINDKVEDADADADASNEIQNLAEVLQKGNDGVATQIKNIADPTDDQDAATKKYVDQLEARLSQLEETIILSQGATDM